MSQGAQSSVLWQPRGMGWGGRWQEGRDVCKSMVTHADVWQKSTQYCKAIILVLAFKEKRRVWGNEWGHLNK